MTRSDGDYVLGTGDEEVRRLGVQHQVWRSRVLDAWARAGFSADQHLVDIGCGPGYATMDLAAITGPSGRVTAIDRSLHFLDIVRGRIAAGRARRADQIDVKMLDLDTEALPVAGADGAWCRWILAFVSDAQRLVNDIHRILKPGGTFVMHEYFDYRAWRLMPRCPEFEEFVAEVMAAWRANGGEPDIALDLIAWLSDAGFEIVETRPYVDVVGVGDDIWRWPTAFVDSGLSRLVEIGRMDPERADDILGAFAHAAGNRSTRMVTPAVLEIIARKI